VDVAALAADIAFVRVAVRDAPHEVWTRRWRNKFALVDHALANLPKACTRRKRNLQALSIVSQKSFVEAVVVARLRV
jgi:hypothetical protein